MIRTESSCSSRATDRFISELNSVWIEQLPDDGEQNIDGIETKTDQEEMMILKELDQ